MCFAILPASSTLPVLPPPHYPWSPALPLVACSTCSQVCKILTGIALFYLVNFFQMCFAILPACSTLPVLPRPHYLWSSTLPLFTCTTPGRLLYFYKRSFYPARRYAKF